MATAANGWPVLFSNRTTGPHPRLRKFIIPGTGRHFLLRDGSAGFLLAYVALWWHENLHPINLGIWDEWGWAVRPVRGQEDGYSNHAPGTAADIDATRHPRGVRLSVNLSVLQVAKIRRFVKTLGGTVFWGGDYNRTVDGMHFEIDRGMPDVERMARSLCDSPMGRRILAANPGLSEVIWDGPRPAPTPGDPVTEPDPIVVPQPKMTRGIVVDRVLVGLAALVADLRTAKPSARNKGLISTSIAALNAGAAALRRIKPWRADPNPPRR